MRTVAVLALLTLVLLARPGVAQEGVKYTDRGGWDTSALAGAFLPFGIVGVRDSYPAWAVMFSHPSAIARVEYGFMDIDAKGVKMYSGSIGFRIDYRVLDAVDGFFTLGLDG